jgi:hypothetical protein
MAPEVSTVSPTPVHNGVQLIFLSRVSSLPLINSALESAKTLYDTSKTKYQVIDQIENSVKTRVVPQFQPLLDSLHAYEAQLGQLDSFACSGLDILETNLPIIKEPTEKVIESSRRLVDDVVFTPVKNVSSTVSKSLEDGKQLIAGASVAVDERLKASSYLTEAIHFSESFADRILGPDSEPIPSDTAPLTRASHFVYSVNTRLTKHAVDTIKPLQSVHLPNPAHLAQLARATDIVKYTNERLEDQIQWLQNFVATSQQQLAPAQQQLSSTAHHVTESVVVTLNTIVNTVSTYVPQGVKSESYKLRQLLIDQLAQLNKTDSSFFHNVVEAAQTGRNYLEVVRVQLTEFYSSKVAQYIPSATAHAEPVELKE